MKKQYIFLLLLLIILYVWYLILSFKYKEYKINSHINYIVKLNEEISKRIKEANNLIEYKSSKAYKNKILKEQQWYKNKAEIVVFLTNEQRFNIYTSDLNKDSSSMISFEDNNTDNIIENKKNMTIFEKWFFLIFWKDISL